MPIVRGGSMTRKIVVVLLLVMFVDATVLFVSANPKTKSISCKIGWPFAIDDIVLGPPTLADVDNDGTLEIILGSTGDFVPDSGKIYVLKHTGTMMENFPVKVGYLAGGIPAAGDINNDGFLEIIDDATRNSTAHSEIHALSYTGESIAGWPVETNGSYGRPSLSDIDNDGFLDVIVTGWHAGTQECYVASYNRFADAVTGWPRWVSCPEGMRAIGDINNDSNLEIVVGTARWYANDTGGIYAFDHEGNILDGFPVETGKRFPAPITLADLDNDGDLEIIGSADEGHFNVYVYHHNGTKMLELPNGNGLYHEIVPVDMDGDGDLELVSVTNGYVNAFHHTGESVNGWPVSFVGTPNGGGGSANGEPGVVVGDIDNDNESEILLSTMTTTKNRIYAWNPDGSLVDGFPIEFVGGPFGRYVNGALALGDLDGNGNIDLVFVGYQQDIFQGVYRTDIYVFEMNSHTHAATMPWPQFHHDAQHTGVYKKTNSPPSAPSITGPLEGKIHRVTSYNVTTSDPNNDSVYYFIDWGDGTNSKWIGSYPSGDIVTESHTWPKKGTYTIKAKAKDVNGAESGWGTLTVTMPLSYEPPHNRFFTWLFGRFPHAFPILRHLMGY